MSHKKKIVDILKEKNLCNSGLSHFDGKTIEEIASDPNCGMDWISLFVSKVAGEEGWPTAKDLISKALKEVNLYKKDYLDPVDTWIQPSLDDIQSWLDGKKTDEEVKSLGRDNFGITRFKSERTKEVYFAKSVSALSLCLKSITNLPMVYNMLSKAISLDPLLNKKKKEALKEMIERFDIKKTVICDKLKDCVE